MTLVAGGVAGLLLAGMALLIDHLSYNIWGGLVLGPTLVLLTWPIARRVARSDDDPSLVKFLLVALLAKFAGSVIRYVVIYGLYGGAADANRYDRVGQELAMAFRDGVFSGIGEISGTRFLEVATGALYTVIGPTNLGGFLVFSWCSFLGFLLFYRAFRIALPTGDHHRYRLLLFFLPSMLFWPSSLGKEALMLFFLGLAAYGLACILGHRQWGFVWFGVGLWAAAVLRPHMALVFLAGAIPAIVVRRRRDRPGSVGPAIGGTKVALVVLVIGMSALVATRAQEYFGLEDLSQESAGGLLETTEDQSSRGGSEFNPPNPDSPFGYIAAAVTVVLRPLPFEARSAQALFSAVEGLGIVVLAVLSRRRLRHLPVALLREPLVAFALAYTAVFIYAFSVISNFGLLARQRTQLFPVLLILLALPPAVASATGRGKAAQLKQREGRARLVAQRT